MKIRTLIIEGDESLRRLLVEIVQRRGHQVTACADPGHCLLYGSRETPACSRPEACSDILFLDLDRGWRSGLDLLEKQKSLGCRLLVDNRAWITVDVSLYHPQEAAHRVAAVGCRVFEKPFRVEAINAWLSECEGRLREASPA